MRERKAVTKVRNVLANGAREVVSTQLLRNLLEEYDLMVELHDEAVAERDHAWTQGHRLVAAVAPPFVLDQEDITFGGLVEEAVKHAAVLRDTLLEYERRLGL